MEVIIYEYNRQLIIVAYLCRFLAQKQQQQQQITVQTVKKMTTKIQIRMT